MTAAMSNDQPPPPLPLSKLRCFRHQFQKMILRCELCRAKQAAAGDFERARKIFVSSSRNEEKESRKF
jgi:hypothetical protein